MHKLFDDQQISFPKNLYCKNSYNGRNIRELAQKFGISERRVRQIMHKP